jgi:hypothetical protein
VERLSKGQTVLPWVEVIKSVCAQICYNFVRIHKTLRTTPAMAANITKRLWEIGDIVDVLEAWESE